MFERPEGVDRADHDADDDHGPQHRKVRWLNTRQVVVPSIAAASNGSFGRPLQAGKEQQGEPRRPQPDVGQQDDAERAPALDQPGLTLETERFEHGVHDAELVVEHPAAS